MNRHKRSTGWGFFVLTASLFFSACAANPEKIAHDFSEAVFNGDTAETERLLDAGAQVNVIQPHMQLTPLSLAAYQGDLEIMTLLLDRGADVAMYNGNEYGTTALIEAAQKNQIEAVKLLIESGADVNQRDKFGDPALNWAVFFGHKDMVILLIEKNADLTMIGSSGGTALKTAIAKRNAEIEQILRDAGMVE